MFHKNKMYGFTADKMKLKTIMNDTKGDVSHPYLAANRPWVISLKQMISQYKMHINKCISMKT